MKISIFGLGYVGSVSCGCFSAMGHEIIGVDISTEKNESINSGVAPIFEKNLNDLISKGVHEGKIIATDEAEYAVKKTQVSLVCVGTPSDQNGNINLSYVRKVCKEIGTALKNKEEFHTIAIRSTIPPGTIEDEIIPLITKKSGKKVGEDFDVAMNPEFLREGSAIEDFINPERIIIGSNNSNVFNILRKIYQSKTDFKIISKFYEVPIKMAELCKYVDNSFHALKVVFANEIGTIAKNLDIDSQELMSIFCEDKKLNISSTYLRPGFSFGGSCLPKDLQGLNYIGKSLGEDFPLLSSISPSNEEHTLRALKLLKNLKKNKILFLGLSFKGDTDDLRNNPIINIIKNLSKSLDRDIFIFDELANINYLVKDNVRKVNNIEEAIENCEVIVLSNDSKNYERLLTNSKAIIIDLNKSLTNIKRALSLV